MNRPPLPLPTPGRSAAPQVAYGPGAVHQLPSFVSQMGAERVLLLCGKRSFTASGAAEVLPDLASVAHVHRWDDFRVNTDAEDLASGLELLQRYDPDLVLAIGGGSAIDMAKLLVSYDGLAGDQVTDAIRSGRKGETRVRHLALIPTTSGSGAEATHFAVVYIGDEKFSIAGPAMRADALVLDPRLTLSGSRYQRATSGIDAVAQAIESLWATGSSERSRRFARHALRLLMPAIEPFVNDGDETAARAMMIGAHLAGRAIDISKTTAAHALSYAITKGYGISHGHAVTLTLGHFIEAHGRAQPETMQPGLDPDTHAQSMQEILHRLGAADPGHGREQLHELMTRLGLETSLSAVGVTSREETDRLAAGVNVERLRNNPVLFDGPQLRDLLARAS